MIPAKGPFTNENAISIMKSTPLPISIVIPFYNEAHAIEAVLTGINQQACMPQEVILVNAGSNDDSADVIQRWTQINSPLFDLMVLHRDRAYPGAARNHGIDEAKCQWIALLDAGIIPNPNWLNKLYQMAMTHQKQLCWGSCRFAGTNWISIIFCALSFGQGRKRNMIVPISLFHISVFEKSGLFPIHLRAYEDVLWRKNVLSLPEHDLLCKEALADYRSFPDKLSAGIYKYFQYGKSIPISKVSLFPTIVLICYFILIIFSLYFWPILGIGLLLLYLMARGILDPIRRSANIAWFGKKWYLFFLTIPIALLVDISKIAGFIVGTMSQNTTKID